MKFTTTLMHIWSTEIEDKAGGLARTLRVIADFGANLNYVAAHRLAEKPGKGILLISSSDSRLELDHVTDVGLRRVPDRAMLKIEGHDEPALGAKLAGPSPTPGYM